MKNSDDPMDRGLVNQVTVGPNKKHQERYRNTINGGLRLPELMSVTELRNVFPTNIGSMQLNNMEPRLLTFTVSFSYERYKFYPRSGVDNDRSLELLPMDLNSQVSAWATLMTMITERSKIPINKITELIFYGIT